MKIKAYKKLTYPANLWSVVLDREVSMEEIPREWETVLIYVFETLKNKQNVDTLLYYLKEGQTLDMIGTHYGVSREAIRKHIGKAVRDLRRPKRIIFFLYDFEKALAMQKEEEKKDPFEEWHLSVRARNCLRRTGIYTIEDLKNCKRSELMKLRNMGVGTLKEIEQALAQRGYSLSEEPEVFSGLDFGNRALTWLNRGGIHSVEELVRYTESDLMDFPGIGVKVIENIKCALEEQGLSLREEM